MVHADIGVSGSPEQLFTELVLLSLFLRPWQVLLLEAPLSDPFDPGDVGVAVEGDPIRFDPGGLSQGLFYIGNRLKGEAVNDVVSALAFCWFVHF